MHVNDLNKVFDCYIRDLIIMHAGRHFNGILIWKMSEVEKRIEEALAKTESL